MFKNYCTLLILSICLLSACKGDKEKSSKPEKTAALAQKEPQKKAATKTEVKKPIDAKKSASANKSGKTRKGYWTGLQDFADFPEDKFEKLRSLEKERRAKLSKAADKDKPGINKDYTAKKKSLLGHKLFRAYREYDKKWKQRSK